MSDDDFLDGCDEDGMFDHAKVTADVDVPAVVLFADVQFDDREAVAARQAEWQELFG